MTTVERTNQRMPAVHRPVDKYGALLVAAEAVRLAREFGLPEPDGIGIGPTGVIEAAMPLEVLLEWQKVLGPGPREVPAEARRLRAVPDARTGSMLIFGWFEHRQWVLRSTEAR
jgi:hypothetical protein